MQAFGGFMFLILAVVVIRMTIARGKRDRAAALIAAEKQ